MHTHTLKCTLHAIHFPSFSWEPIYVQYHLMGTSYKTSGRERGGASMVSWNETKVTLLGTRDHAHLLEYLRGPPLTLELHDRDRRVTPPPIWSLYGKERDDQVIGAQTYCQGNKCCVVCGNWRLSGCSTGMFGGTMVNHQDNSKCII